MKTTRRPAELGARRPIRVLHFLTGFGLGGSERQVVRLVGGLARSGLEVHLACFRKEGPLLQEVAGHPCEEFPIASFRRPVAIARQIAFARHLRRHDFDVVHATGLHANVFVVPAARLVGVPAVIASIRDLGDPWTPLERRVQRAACRFAHETLVNSQAVAARLEQEGYDPSALTVIHNAVAPPPAIVPPPSAAAYDPLHEELGVPPGAPVVGVVARMVRVKGIQYFLEAAARLAPRFPSARFVLVGGPIPGSEIRNGSTYEDELRRLVEARGLQDRVIFAGDRTDAERLLRRFTVFVLPSLSEGLPNALLEALAAGVPAVATRVGGSPEIVEDGLSGLLVPPRDAGGLAHAIGRLLADPRLARRLGRAGAARAATRFTESMLVERTAARYLRLLGAAGRAPARETIARRATRRVAPAGLEEGRRWGWSPAWRRR